VVQVGGTSSIDIDAFLASRKGATRRFLEAFSRAQHFEEFIKASHRPAARDELFESLLAEKTRNRQKLLRLPEFKSLTLRSKLRRQPSAAHSGVSFDAAALISEPTPAPAVLLQVFCVCSLGLCNDLLNLLL
jgi:hypothetical protein